MTLSKRLFLAIFATMTMVGVVVIVTIQQLSLNSFSDYLKSVESQQATELSRRLAAALGRHGDFSIVLNDPEAWPDIHLPPRHHRSARSNIGRASRPPPPGRDGHRPPPRGLSMPPREFGQSSRPPPTHRPSPNGDGKFFLLTENKEVVGVPKPKHFEFSRYWPVTVDDEVVAWLALPELPEKMQLSDSEFKTRLIKGAWIVGGVVVLIAIVLSALLAVSLRKPLLTLLSGTRDFSQGIFPQGLPVERSDEFGELARAFSEMCRQLETAKEREKQWVSDVAHELRTPLAVLRGEIEAVQDGIIVLDDTTLGSLQDEVLHLGNIIDDLNLLSCADANNLRLECESVNLLEFLERILSMFQHRFSTHNLSVVKRYCENLQANQSSVDVDIDERRMTQVFSNIFENCIRYSDPGDIVIDVEIVEGNVLITIQDAGPGVPEDMVHRLFDRLFRTDEARSRIAGGSGLGLSICQSILHAHGGQIRANNCSGGLRIEITVPSELDE